MSDLAPVDVRYLFGTTKVEELQQHPELMHRYSGRDTHTPSHMSVFRIRNDGRWVFYYDWLCKRHQQQLELFYRMRIKA